MGLDLLEAIADALADWSATVGRAVQRLTTSTRQPALQQDAAAELHETRTWLLLAAGSMLQCMWSEMLYSKVHERQLLDTLGQLLRRVLPSSLSFVAWQLSEWCMFPLGLLLTQMNCALLLSSRRQHSHPCAGMAHRWLRQTHDSPSQALRPPVLLPPQVVGCEETEQRAAVAGLWPSESALPAAACVMHLHHVVTEMLSGRGGLLRLF